ncbi:aldehyde dehydrogenase, partial [bacterium]|nr:aldehyde dehydrogenase [bacterium]
WAASQVWVRREHLDAFTASFHEKCKQFAIGGPGESAFMGPLPDPAVMDRYFKFIGISEREGASILMRGKPLSHKTGGNFVTPTLAVFEDFDEDRMRRSVSLQTEILAPHLSVIAYGDEEELVRILSRSTYGHSASIYGSPEIARTLGERLAYGRIGINRGLYGFDPLITARVGKRSGNHARLGWGLFSQLSRERWVG